MNTFLHLLGVKVGSTMFLQVTRLFGSFDAVLQGVIRLSHAILEVVGVAFGLNTPKRFANTAKYKSFDENSEYNMTLRDEEVKRRLRFI